MTGSPCVVSVAEHTGWAHLVCVAAVGRVPAVVARRRVALIDEGLPTQPYEHDSTALRADEADALIARVRQSALARARDALGHVVADLAPSHAVVALAIRRPPFDRLPGSVGAVRESYRLQCAADGMLFHLAVRRAAEKLGLDVQLYPRGEETARAAEALGVAARDVDEFVRGAGRPAGPPWTDEHRRAFASGMALLAARVDWRLDIGPGARRRPR